MTYAADYAYLVKRYGNTRLGRFLARRDATANLKNRKAN